MLEPGAGADILRGLGWLYISFVVALVWISLWFPERWWQKLVGVVVVLLVFTGPAYLRERERAKTLVAQNANYQVAKALFDERCRHAGQTIYRTIDDVEGVLLLEIRGNEKIANESNPNWPDAGLPHEHGGMEYIANFLKWEHVKPGTSGRGFLNYSPSDSPGYRYVDVANSERDGYRYILINRGKPQITELSRSVLNDKSTRYAVTFVNMIDPIDRAKWVAGTTVIVTDTWRSETIAKATWYSIEPGQGNTSGFRQPWARAQTCPEWTSWDGARTRMFVDQVLKPKKGEYK